MLRLLTALLAFLRNRREPFRLPRACHEKVGYTGHAYDPESGLTYAGARFYDSAVGRFLSIDPVGFTGTAFSFNHYAYANNNPYAYTDPTGMCPKYFSGCDNNGANQLDGLQGVNADDSIGESGKQSAMAAASSGGGNSMAVAGGASGGPGPAMSTGGIVASSTAAGISGASEGELMPLLRSR